jgi:pyrroline-5-carboxylate reductase
VSSKIFYYCKKKIVCALRLTLYFIVVATAAKSHYYPSRARVSFCISSSSSIMAAATFNGTLAKITSSTSERQKQNLSRRIIKEQRRRRTNVVIKTKVVNNNNNNNNYDKRSFIERDADKSARVLQNQEPLRFGFIGCGAMAEAMARGFLDSKVIEAESIACYGGKNQAINGRADLFRKDLGIENIVSNASAVLDESEIIFLCVKPNKMMSIIDEIKPRVKPWHVFVSVAAGIKTSDIENRLNIGIDSKSNKNNSKSDKNNNAKAGGKYRLFNLGGRQKTSDHSDDDFDNDEYDNTQDYDKEEVAPAAVAQRNEGEEVFFDEPVYDDDGEDNENFTNIKTNENATPIRSRKSNDLLPSPMVVRVMPNTPCFVREGAIACCGGKTADLATVEMISTLFSKLGLSVMVEESQMHAVVGVSGSGPAYVFAFIEALADGGVLNGLPRNVALKLACQTVIGAGKLCLETQVHPGELKDRVCSPGGTTIAAMRELERNNFRSAVIEAVTASAEKSKQMNKS